MNTFNNLPRFSVHIILIIVYRLFEFFVLATLTCIAQLRQRECYVYLLINYSSILTAACFIQQKRGLFTSYWRLYQRHSGQLFRGFHFYGRWERPNPRPCEPRDQNSIFWAWSPGTPFAVLTMDTCPKSIFYDIVPV